MWLADRDNKIKDENFLGDIKSAFSFTEKYDELSLGGLATVGSGWTVSMNSVETTEAGGSLGVPLLEKILKIDLASNSKTKNTVKVRVGKVYKRVLIGELFWQKIRSLSSDSAILKSLRDGTLVVTMSDIVLEDVQITVDDSLSLGSDADLELKNLSEQVGVDTGGAIGAQFQVTSTGDHDYVLSSKEPLVVAVKNRRMTAPPGLEALMEKKRIYEIEQVAYNEKIAEQKRIIVLAGKEEEAAKAIRAAENAKKEALLAKLTLEEIKNKPPNRRALLSKAGLYEDPSRIEKGNTRTANSEENQAIGKNPTRFPDIDQPIWPYSEAGVDKNWAHNLIWGESVEVGTSLKKDPSSLR